MNRRNLLKSLIFLPFAPKAITNLVHNPCIQIGWYGYSVDIYHDLYISPEALEDIRNWGVDEIDDLTRTALLTGK